MNENLINFATSRARDFAHRGLVSYLLYRSETALFCIKVLLTIPYASGYHTLKDYFEYGE